MDPTQSLEGESVCGKLLQSFTTLLERGGCLGTWMFPDWGCPRRLQSELGGFRPLGHKRTPLSEGQPRNQKLSVFVESQTRYLYRPGRVVWEFRCQKGAVPNRTLQGPPLTPRLFARVLKNSVLNFAPPRRRSKVSSLCRRKGVGLKVKGTPWWRGRGSRVRPSDSVNTGLPGHHDP